jgi:phosphoenolpyruvate synthase/pyruvate phosphate dikinase
VPPGFCVVGEVAGSEIAAAYEKLGSAPVAVRSSGLSEDSSTASFAGQHDTYLNVRGADAVIGAVRQCAASGGSEHARRYRARQGFDTEAPLPVLVQALVIADAAGVAFSVSPTSPQHLLVNAAWGLGESVVSSQVTPDSYSISRSTFAMTAAAADKQVMTVAVPDGVRTVATPRFLRRRRCLREHDLLLVAELALELEREHARPVDLEFAFKDGQLHLLQCRPITA